MSLDPRLTLARDGIAARRLEGLVPAEVYLDTRGMQGAVPSAAIRRAPQASAEQMDQLLFGEPFEVLEEEGPFVFGEARRSGYVGFVAAADLAARGPAPTHRIAALRTYAFEGPSIKSRALGPYSANSLVRIEATEGRLALASGAGWIAADHLAPIGVVETDWTTVAERFLAAPYLWGGRESLGLDCSGLVQQALFACGRACPRDTDQQVALGRAIPHAEFTRGDLVFWKGHVAIGLDGTGQAARIIHANAHHMAVSIEPLAAAIARISGNGYGEPTAFRRL
ncbi:NlpC/P60 family protein [Phenylobacterium sp.]|uniref:C40 family peptidase n=1 Tax=Phenylobacterium sp. TaxID=1871053 RepID=UPI003782F1B0